MDRKDWIRKDLKYNWHPYTQMKDCEKDPPLLITKAKGVRLYDANNNYYYDTISSWWCNIHGHNHPRLNAAMKRQVSELDHVLFAGFTHKAAVLLSEKLISVAPKGLSKVFYSDNGSTAVETALKLSYQYWQNTGKARKTKFVSLDHGYHGDTLGAMSLGGIGLFNKVFSGLFFNSFKVPSPYCYRCPVGKKQETCGIECIGPLEKLFAERSGEIAALVMEPIVMAAGGMIIYPAAYLKRAAAFTKKYGIHLILDEVATGFGRTGKMFAAEHTGVRPDFLCLSKGLTAGYLPMGATLTTDKVYKAFYADYGKKKTFYHGHTFTANPISCAVALESLKIFEDEAVLEKAAKASKVLQDGLDRFRSLSIVGDVRGIGMIGAIELVKDKRTKEPFSFEERIGHKIYKEGLKKHIILRPLGNIVYLFLPLSIKTSEIEYITDSAYKILQNHDHKC